MPRRTRLTMAPKKHKKKQVGGDPNAPTDEEWKTLTEFGSFIVRDEDGEEHTFKRGDTAAVLPHGVRVGDGLEIHDYWVGRIREVRLRSADDVWTRVQWYWSGEEVHGVVKSFDPQACNEYERIFSDHFDYVSTSAFDAVVPMKKLNNDDISQPFIPRDVFYTRYTFEYRARVIQPKPGDAECICSYPYAPHSTQPIDAATALSGVELLPPKNPGRTQPSKSAKTTTHRLKKSISTVSLNESLSPAALSLQHFCPRPACRRFFHAACLLTAGYGDFDTGAASRKARLLRANPDLDGVFELGPSGKKIVEKEKEARGGKGKTRGGKRAKANEMEDEPARKRVRVGEPLNVESEGRTEEIVASASARRSTRGTTQVAKKSRISVGKRISIRDDPMGVDGEGGHPSGPDDGGASDSEDSDADNQILMHSLPGDLLLVAEQPIIRGAAFAVGGVSGNVGAVVKARRMVYEALANGGEVPEDWLEALGVTVRQAVVEVVDGLGGEESDGDEEAVVNGRGMRKPMTKAARSKRKAKAKAKSVDRVGTGGGVAALLCPQCGGAI